MRRAEDVARDGFDAARRRLRALSPRSRHEALLSAHDEWFGAGSARNVGQAMRDAAYETTDEEALRREHAFLRCDEADGARKGDWGVALARRYYERLVKTYAVCDLSRVGVGRGGRSGEERGRAGQVGMRWRTENEVRKGKGQFTCGERKCEERQGLETYECHFKYEEKGERKQALVKVRVCRRCAEKLNKSDESFRRVSSSSRRERKDRKRKRSSEDRREERESDEARAERKILDGLLS
jgi:hypothetical protein